MKLQIPPKVLLVIIVTIFTTIPSTYAQKKQFTYKQIFNMAGPRLTQFLPTIRKWIDDEHYLEYKNLNGSRTKSLFTVNALTGEEEVYIDYGEWKKQLPEGLNLMQALDNSEDYMIFLFRKNNDLFYLSIADNVFKRLTDDGEEKLNPTLSPDGKFAAYTKGGDLYAYDIENESEKRLSNDATDVVYNGYSSWVYYEEILGRSSRHRAFWWSPDSRKLAYMRFDDTPVPEYTLYNPDGVRGEWETTYYPEAGDPLPYVKMGVADIKTGKTTWADFDEYADEMIAWPSWTPNSEDLIVQWIPRSMDNIKLFKVSCKTGEKNEIYNEAQQSWVEWFEDLYVFNNGSGFIVRSDKDGWRHLYYYDAEGDLKVRLTSGEWTVKQIVTVDEKNKTVYFEGNMDESTEQQLYKVNLDGSGFEQITQEKGTHNCMVSPTGKLIIDRFSNIETPTELLLLDGDGEIIKTLADSKSEVMDDYQLGKTEIFRITTKDGYELPVKWVLPADFDESKKYPVLFSVYGGPGSMSVFNSWSRFSSPHYYAQEGIIYAQMDHRGAGHHGKKGEALLHRKLGEVDIDDYIEIAEWFSKQPFIDSNKIAINGGSYGGYAALMAITRGAGVFDYAVAEYSVTDWRLYDNVYTERYMDTPEENPEGYEFGSVITHADKYVGYVLITHGLLDDNVHAQNSFQVIDKFEDMNKDFEFILYPDARHGVGFPKFFHAAREKMQFWFTHLLERDFDPEKN